MTELKTIAVKIHINPADTLEEAWDKFVIGLEDGGMDEYTIDMMRTAFYVGATQVVAAFDIAARTEEKPWKEIHHVMSKLYGEVTEQMQHSRDFYVQPEGNA